MRLNPPTFHFFLIALGLAAAAVLCHMGMIPVAALGLGISIGSLALYLALGSFGLLAASCILKGV